MSGETTGHIGQEFQLEDLITSQTERTSCLSQQTTFKNVCFVFAMREEASPLIETLGLTQDRSYESPFLPYRLYKGQFKGLQVAVAVNGIDDKHNVSCVGTVDAAVNALRAFEHLHPDVIINAGTAGGFANQGTKIGEIVMGAQAVFHDHRIPLPGYDEFGRNQQALSLLPELAEELGLKVGTISTGDSLDTSAEDLREIVANNATVKEMECAAIARILSSAPVAFCAIKSVTDLIDAPASTTEQFVQNLSLASKNLRDSCVELLEHLSSSSSVTVSKAG